MQILSISAGLVHTATVAIPYWSALVHSKKLKGREAAFTKGHGTNPANRSRIGPKFEWYGKVNQKSGRFANEQSHSRMSRKGRFSSAPFRGPAGFPRVHASACHSLSWLLSPSILEKLSFPAGVFFNLFLETTSKF